MADTNGQTVRRLLKEFGKSGEPNFEEWAVRNFKSNEIDVGAMREAALTIAMKEGKSGITNVHFQRRFKKKEEANDPTRVESTLNRKCERALFA